LERNHARVPSGIREHVRYPGSLPDVWLLRVITLEPGLSAFGDPVPNFVRVHGGERRSHVNVFRTICGVCGGHSSPLVSVFHDEKSVPDMVVIVACVGAGAMVTQNHREG
jgi:hypothetical protein